VGEDYPVIAMKKEKKKGDFFVSGKGRSSEK